MELKFILEKLKEQKSGLKFAVLDIWFPTTYQYIEDHFYSYSSRARTFDNLFQEYETQKRNSKNPLFTYNAFDDIKRKAEGFLSEIISVLEHEYEQQQAAAKNAADNFKKQQEHLAKLASTPKQQIQAPAIQQKPIPAPEPKVIIKTQLPFGIKAEFFWTIMVVIVGFSYWLGTKWEHFDLRDEVKNLKSDTMSNGKKIREYTLVIETKDKTIDSISYSLDKIKKSFDSLLRSTRQ